jgi:CubicO group peptidase (beta-lactamase class C family)
VAIRWNRIETWLVVIVAGAGVILLGVAGLWVYISATTKPLHPNAADVKSSAASQPSAEWDGAVEQGRQLVRAAVAEQNLPGLSIAVGSGGSIVWAEGFGFADIDSRAPVTTDTPFRIGTLSTPLTAAAAGLLIEQGKLNIDEPIQKYVPEFPAKPWPVTVRELMGHTAGLRSDSGDEGPLFGERCDTPAAALRHFAGGELFFEPGTQYRFSNYGWIVVSAAIEAAAGDPFLIFMRKQIFAPLGMEHTSADAAITAAGNRATSYFPRFASDPRYGPDPMRDLNYSCYAGASVFQSTPSDLVRFAQAIEGGTLLQPSTAQLLQAPQHVSSGLETGYGLGWDIENVMVAGTATKWIGHDGMILGGAAASLMTFPEFGLVVAITSNTSYADTESLGVKIADAFAPQSKRGVAKP